MNKHINKYYNLDLTAETVRQGKHRQWVGGKWDDIGRLLLDFLKNRGLNPKMFLLDVGCGCLRCGIPLVDYLESGHYYGIDISQDLLDAGYETELAEASLQDKLPRENLACNSEFDAEDFGMQFDIVVAQSLFSHLPLNHIKLCLKRLCDIVPVGGVFYATFFHSPANHDWTKALSHSPGGITTYPANDPYHYRNQDLEYCVAELPWRFQFIGNWGHPRKQFMAMFTRTED